MHEHAPEFEAPSVSGDERKTLLGFLDWKRAAVLHTARELSDEQGRWTPDGRGMPTRRASCSTANEAQPDRNALGGRPH